MECQGKMTDAYGILNEEKLFGKVNRRLRKFEKGQKRENCLSQNSLTLERSIILWEAKSIIPGSDQQHCQQWTASKWGEIGQDVTLKRNLPRGHLKRNLWSKYWLSPPMLKEVHLKCMRVALTYYIPILWSLKMVFFFFF